MTMRLSPDFSAFVVACAEHDVRCLVVGGYALAAHGFPRNTKDLDVWVEPDPANASCLVEIACSLATRAGSRLYYDGRGRPLRAA